MKNALIVIDVQNYFLNDDTRHLPAKITAYIKKNRFDFLLFTKFVNNSNSNFSKSFGWKKCTHSPDIDFPDELLAFADNGNVFEKNTFSAFKNERMIKFLMKNEISTVYLCGTDSDACVLASAYDAFDLGFGVKVIKELCASCNGKEFHEYGKAIMERNLEKKPV